MPTLLWPVRPPSCLPAHLTTLLPIQPLAHCLPALPVHYLLADSPIHLPSCPLPVCMLAVMDLVLFDDALRHVCRIARIISNPGGHALLVGVGGSGKQSLARLAAHMCGYACETVVISGSYSLSNFAEDLQRMYRRAGLKVMPERMRNHGGMGQGSYREFCRLVWKWLLAALAGS